MRNRREKEETKIVKCQQCKHNTNVIWNAVDYGTETEYGPLLLKLMDQTFELASIVFKFGSAI